MNFLLSPLSVTRCLLFSVILLSVTASTATFRGAAPVVANSASADAALWRAIVNDDTQGLIAALKAGANADSEKMPEDVSYRWRQYPDLEGVRPLFAAIFLEKSDLALLLLDYGADPMSSSPRGSTPVQAAISMGQEKVFFTLLDKGADILSEPAILDDPESLRLVDLAAIGGSLKIMSAVRTAGHALPTDQQERLKLLKNSLFGAPRMFEYLVDETGIALSQEIVASLVEKARYIHSEAFLRYFQRKGYLADNSLPQILTDAVLRGMDGLAGDLLVAHPDLWSTDMNEAITQRIGHGDPMPMVDLFFRLGRKNDLLPFLDSIFLNCGLNGDEEAFESLLDKFDRGKSQESHALGLALLGAVKGLYDKRETEPGFLSDEMRNRYEGLARKLMEKPRIDIDVADEEGRTILWFAIQNESHELAKQLLAKGAEAKPDPADSFNNPGYLHSACLHGMNDLVSDLVAAGAGLEARDRNGFTPLGCAVEKKNAAMVHALLSAGADPNSLNGRSLTDVSKANPFLQAVASKDKAIVSIFLQPLGSWKIDPHLFGPATILAIESDEVEILEQILSTGNAISRQNEAFFQDNSPIIHALYAHQPRMIGPLIKYGAELVPPGHTAAEMICHAVAREGVEMTRALLDAGLGVDVSCQNIPLLSEAVISGDVAMTTLLLERGADIDAAVTTGEMQGWTPLLFAVSENKPELVDLLAGRGASMEVLGLSMMEERVPWDQIPKTMTPLLKAAQLGQVDMIRSLTRAGANINQVNGEGFTALMIAARFGQVDAVKTLLLLGADVNPMNGHRSGVLELAGLSKNIAIQRLLLGKIGDGEKEKALVVAARLGEFAPINRLLQENDFNARELDRALHAALRANPEDLPPRNLVMPEEEGQTRLQIIRTLVAAGADPNTRVYRESSYNTLLGNGYGFAWQKQMAILLDELGADINQPSELLESTVLMEAARMEDAEMVALFLELGADPCLRDKRGLRALNWVAKNPENAVRKALVKGGALQCKN